MTVDGFTVSDGYGSTTINGDKIRSGTIEGVTLISVDGDNNMVRIMNGGITLGEAPYWPKGYLYYDMDDGKVYLYSVPGRSIKIESGDGLSILRERILHWHKHRKEQRQCINRTRWR